MAEEKIVSESGTSEVTGTSEDYIAAINQLKSTTVARSEYEAIRAENKRLLDSLVNGATDGETTTSTTPAHRDPQEIRKELFDVDNPLSNLEYITKAIELRESLLAKGERDPFLPWGEHITPTDEDVAKANNAAEIFKHCIEYADGDDEVFTNELQRITIDAMPIRGRKR